MVAARKCPECKESYRTYQPCCPKCASIIIDKVKALNLITFEVADMNDMNRMDYRLDTGSIRYMYKSKNIYTISTKCGYTVTSVEKSRGRDKAYHNHPQLSFGVKHMYRHNPEPPNNLILKDNGYPKIYADPPPDYSNRGCKKL